MKVLHVIIEKAPDNYSAYIKEVDGVITTGKTVAEIKRNIKEAVRLFVDVTNEYGTKMPKALQGEYTFEFQMDIQSLLGIYQGIFTKAGLQRITGVNQKLLCHYASGLKKPRESQRKKIEAALHNLGSELSSISL